MTRICAKLLIKDILLSRQTSVQKNQYKHLTDVLNVLLYYEGSQLTFTWLNSTIETLEKGVKYVQSSTALMSL